METSSSDERTEEQKSEVLEAAALQGVEAEHFGEVAGLECREGKESNRRRRHCECCCCRYSRWRSDLLEAGYDTDWMEGSGAVVETGAPTWRLQEKSRETDQVSWMAFAVDAAVEIVDST